MKTKICFKCKKRKELASYYPHPQMGDGHLNKCKECTKRDVFEHRNANLARIQAYDRQRAMYPHRVKKRALWVENNPIATAAGLMVRQAVKRGKIVKPDKCSECGKEGRINGHHEDYNYPLIVIWLCQSCHRNTHIASGKRAS